MFGSTGFIGSNWMKMYPDISYAEPRDSVSPKYKDVLYLRGTNSNYGIFEDASRDVKVNLLLFTETLKNIKDANSFTLISSWFCAHPQGFYSITKAAQEKLLRSYCRTFHIPFRTIRLSNVIGKDPGASMQKNALEAIIKKIKNNEDVNVYRGDNYRNYIDVLTCCQAIYFLMGNSLPDRMYNVGSDKSHKFIDLVKYCIRRTGSKSKITIIDPPEFHQIVQRRDIDIDTDELQGLGFDNKVDIYKVLDWLCD